VTTKVLVNEQATKSAIQEGLYWLKTETTSRDVAMFFLSGHGTKRGADDYDFLPYDTDDARADLTNLHDFELKYFLGEIPGKTVFFFDTCYSGNVFAGKGFKGDFQADVDKVANEMASVSGSSVAVFTSSTGKQRSREDKQWKHGAFTKAILEALEGKMKYAPDWRISLSRLNVHVAERVKELTQGLQSPTLVLPNALPDLVIARATPGTYR
jgi:uncharacterized caspase-like protein